jgi:hypothetical protein
VTKDPNTSIKSFLEKIGKEIVSLKESNRQLEHILRNIQNELGLMRQLGARGLLDDKETKPKKDS